MPPLLRPELLYLSYVGIETDLIFNHGIDLPEFSLYPKVETEDGRALLRRYAKAQIAIATANGMGAILETPTWMANTDRAAALGYDAEALDRINAKAVTLLREDRTASEHHVLISGNIGPRDDAYAPSEQMDADTACAYHTRQINALRGVDMIGAFTLAYVAEAIGIARAAQAAETPVVLSFTVETDGRLPDGMALCDAMAACDDATDGSAAFYMINCAHPEHFAHVLDGGAWQQRLGGIVANASRCSHAELDAATKLDAGDPKALGVQIAALSSDHRNLRVFGGCCGTDARHLNAIATALSAEN
ncbi:homocysteine S-methyltransferase [Pseudohalocynthiibacter aestuariivivens]|nr:homocysteine S-methyltransferase family protein [Pseudohalocynthiibacter aestuariivivens]QIE46595.1 homocysteine S-methyltransferase [Pseudohalocynthiibacter aestuariivivens]